MKTRRTADREAARSSGKKFTPLHAANAEQAGQDTSVLEPCPVLQAVALTRDLIAARATAIWLRRGCPHNRDEENWREAEAQLKTELGVV
jgi:hypothetical protein